MEKVLLSYNTLAMPDRNPSIVDKSCKAHE